MKKFVKLLNFHRTLLVGQIYFGQLSPKQFCNGFLTKAENSASAPITFELFYYYYLACNLYVVSILQPKTPKVPELR